jgi:hypothetical protein
MWIPKHENRGAVNSWPETGDTMAFTHELESEDGQVGVT